MADLETALINARGTELKVGGASLFTIRRGDVEYVAVAQLAELVASWGIDSYQLHEALQDTQHSKDVHMSGPEAYYLELLGATDQTCFDRALICVDDLVSWSQKVHMPAMLVEDIKVAVAKCKKNRPPERP